jgi:hypothetical protein
MLRSPVLHKENEPRAVLSEIDDIYTQEGSHIYESVPVT